MNASTGPAESAVGGLEVHWPAFAIGSPELLAKYILPAEIRTRIHLPQWGAGAVVSRARAVYEGLCRRRQRIRYAFEQDILIDGAQIVRTPAEVLDLPGNGTCLDLALVLAAGMREAQVPVAVLLVESGLDADERHALVAVHIGSELPPLWPVDPDETLLWPSQPSWFLDELSTDPSGSSAVLVIDPNGLAVDLGTGTAEGLDATFDEAVAAGARYIRDWAWRSGVVPSTRAGSYHPGDAPKEDPLKPLYLPLTDATRPLEYLRPEFRFIPFKPSSEVTILEDLAEQAVESSSTRVVIVCGAGGAGKTRLALEVAHRLRGQGWYSGVLPKGAARVEWLSRVVTPLCVVVDYAEGRLGTPDAPGDIRRLLSALRQRQPGLATLLILTARQTTGGWLEEYRNELHGHRQLVAERVIAIPNHHRDAEGLYARAVRTLAPTIDTLPGLPPEQDTWTTLDYVLYGWLAARSDRPLPATKVGLYDEALTHEAEYWLTVYADIRRTVKPTATNSTTVDPPNVRDADDKNKPSRPRMLRAAAAITLTQPDPDGIYTILTCLSGLKHREVELDALERTFRQCLPAEPGLAVRPDPIGDHLVLAELAGPEEAKTLERLTKDKGNWTRALSTLNRAGQEDHDLAADLIRRLLTRRPKRWPAALTLALQQAGPCAEAIKADVTSHSPTLPLVEMSNSIPFTEFLTSRLGAVIDGVRVANARAHEPAAKVVPLLERLAERNRLLGDRPGALEAIEEAVTLYRALAQATPAVYTPNLATSLNNLSNRLADAGADPGDAETRWLDAITAMPQPVARAELQILYAAHLRGANAARSAKLLVDAASTLDHVVLDNADRSTRVMVPRARQRLRHLAMSMAADGPVSVLEGLPAWASTSIPDSCMELVNSLGGSAGPHAHHLALEKHQATLQSPALSNWLDIIDALHPGHTGTAAARRLGHEVNERGSAAVLAELTDITTRIDLLAGWIDTVSWNASREYHKLHKEQLHHPITRTLLTLAGSAAAQLHHAILVVAEELGIEAAYAIVTDLDKAEEEALRAIDNGELALLAGIFSSSPLTRAGQRTTAVLTQGVLHLTQNRVDRGLSVFLDLRNGLESNTRHAFTVHLNRLAKHRPDLPGLAEAILILDPGTQDP